MDMFFFRLQLIVIIHGMNSTWFKVVSLSLYLIWLLLLVIASGPWYVLFLASGSVDIMY